MYRIFFLSDIHGDFYPIQNLNKRLGYTLDEYDTIVLLGDTGLNYYLNKKDEKFKNQFLKFPCKFFIIRGNHEERVSNCVKRNPDNWACSMINVNNIKGQMYVEKDYLNIVYAMDVPSIYMFKDYTSLIIPGAFSPDKEYRLKKGWKWFEDEQLTSNEKDAGRFLIQRNSNKFDLVLSHTCPISYEPRDLFIPSVDQSKVDKSMEMYLGELEMSLKYKAWLWGHFHKLRDYSRDVGEVTFENPRKLMLYNNKAVELNNIFQDEYMIKTY